MTSLDTLSGARRRLRPSSVTQRVVARLRTTGVITVLTATVFLAFALANNRFTSPINLVNILNQASYLTIVSLGQGLVLISGGFDLSVAAVLGLTSVVAVTSLVVFHDAGLAIGLVIAGAMAIGLLVGAVLGLLNGIAVAYLRVPSFIVTLGIAGIATGTGYQLSGGTPVTGLPPEFVQIFGTPTLRSISTSVYVAAALAFLTFVVMHKTRIGRYIYSIGGNPTAARLSGVDVGRLTVGVFVVSGVLASLAGILLSARVSTGDTNLGGNFVLQSITAGVLGGISLRGGEGAILGAVVGALFIAILGNGMNLENISSYYQMIILGFLLVMAVLAERIRAMLSGRREA